MNKFEKKAISFTVRADTLEREIELLRAMIMPYGNRKTGTTPQVWSFLMQCFAELHPELAKRLDTYRFHFVDDKIVFDERYFVKLREDLNEPLAKDGVYSLKGEAKREIAPSDVKPISFTVRADTLEREIEPLRAMIMPYGNRKTGTTPQVWSFLMQCFAELHPELAKRLNTYRWRVVDGKIVFDERYFVRLRKDLDEPPAKKEAYSLKEDRITSSTAALKTDHPAGEDVFHLAQALAKVLRR